MQTCVQMRKIVGRYFRENFPGFARRRNEDRNIEYRTSNLYRIGDLLFESDIFELEINQRLEKAVNANAFCSLKTLSFEQIVLPKTQADYINDVLINIECIHLVHGTIYEEFYSLD